MVYILFLKEKYQIPAGHLELLWQNSVLPGLDRPAYTTPRREDNSRRGGVFSMFHRPPLFRKKTPKKKPGGAPLFLINKNAPRAG